MKTPAITLQRVYEGTGPEGNYRALVDRVWPRGLRRADLGLDEWARDLAPTTELRKWFHHDPDHWDEFRRRYLAELKDKGSELDELRKLAQAGPITLIYAARDTPHLHATVLRDVLLGASTRTGVKTSTKGNAKTKTKAR